MCTTSHLSNIVILSVNVSLKQVANNLFLSHWSVTSYHDDDIIAREIVIHYILYLLQHVYIPVLVLAP